MTDPGRQDDLSLSLRALSHDEQGVSLGFASSIMRSIEVPARRGVWQRMLDSFSPTTPRRNRVAALALLPATAAVLSFLMVLWLAKPSVASHDDVPTLTSDLLAANLSIYAPGANTVFVAGDFNGWAQNKLRLRDDDKNGTFNMVLYLAPGRYGYVFWVDGKRVLMPNRQKVIDGKRGAHSVLDVMPNRLRMFLPDSAKDTYASALTKLTTSLRNVPVATVNDTRQCKVIPGVRVKNSHSAADELHIVHADGSSMSSLRQPFAAHSTELIVADGSRFSAGDRVLVKGGGHAHLLDVTAVIKRAGSWSLKLAPRKRCTAAINYSIVNYSTVNYAAGAIVLKAGIARAYVRNGALMFASHSAGGNETAVRIASNIHDFQVALGVDKDQDGLLVDTRRDDDEWFYNSVGDSVVDTNAAPLAVRITVLARSSSRGVTGLLQIEDHKLAASAAATKLRVVSLTVALRNLETQP